MQPDQMPFFDQLPLFAQFFIRHPDLLYTLGLLWGLWVAFALGMICFELHAHNSREEKREFRKQLQDERKDRYAVPPDLTLKPPDEFRSMPKGPKPGSL
jgi:hypothetical protein